MGYGCFWSDLFWMVIGTNCWHSWCSTRTGVSTRFTYTIIIPMEWSSATIVVVWVSNTSVDYVHSLAISWSWMEGMIKILRWRDGHFLRKNESFSFPPWLEPSIHELWVGMKKKTVMPLYSNQFTVCTCLKITSCEQNAL